MWEILIFQWKRSSKGSLGELTIELCKNKFSKSRREGGRKQRTQPGRNLLLRASSGKYGEENKYVGTSYVIRPRYAHALLTLILPVYVIYVLDNGN